MSMLAEKRRKQIWSLNPRGKDWSEDSNKFGQKLLEKMGWSQGKGLGAKEDGMREHVKVSYKNDSKGMGYKESDDQWTEHESKFTALLESLGGSEEKVEEIKVNSLEKKSKNSRVRVHYKKFTRGKDLSRYSEKDLANIFGKKSLKEFKKIKNNHEQKEEADNGDDTEKNSFLFNGGLISDYFKKKLPNFGNTDGHIIGNNGVLKKAEGSESESDLKPSFGFGFGFKPEESEYKLSNSDRKCKEEEEEEQGNSKPSFVSYLYDKNNEETPQQNKKNKNKRPVDEDTCLEDSLSKRKKLEPSESYESSQKKKKKSKKKNKEIENGLCNPAFEPMCTPMKVDKHVLDPIEESITEELNDTVGQVAEHFEVNVQINNDNSPKKYSKNRVEIGKKKKKLKGGGEEEKDQEQNRVLDESISEIKRKKKKKAKNNIEIMESMEVSGIFDGEIEDPSTVIATPERKSKTVKANSTESFKTVTENYKESSKYFKIKSKAVELDESPMNTNIQDSKVDSTESLNTINIKYKENSKSSKKKLKDVDIKNDVENISIVSTEESNLNSAKSLNLAKHNFKETSKSSKKKKLKDAIFYNGVENPSLNLSIDSDNPKTNSTESLNTVVQNFEENSKSSRKKKSKTARLENGVENPLFNMSIESETPLCQEENPYEEKVKDKKKKKNKNRVEETSFAVDNPVFNGQDDSLNRTVHQEFEIKRKDKSKKKKNQEETTGQGLDNPALNLSDTIDESCDLMLNVVATPIVPTERKNKDEHSFNIQKVNSVRRRKSVRFSDVTRERIIPTKEEIQQNVKDDCDNDIVEVEGKLNDSYDMSPIDKFMAKKKLKIRKQGLDNTAFDRQATNLEENLTSISNTLDQYQAEIENDINEAKLKTVELSDIMVGEVGNPDGSNEVLPDGSVKLKFKHAKFGKTAHYASNWTGPKKSYKHLIKGDIVLHFKETNLHEVEGYAVKSKG